jgi:hypothetical protein
LHDFKKKTQHIPIMSVCSWCVLFAAALVQLALIDAFLAQAAPITAPSLFVNSVASHELAHPSLLPTTALSMAAGAGKKKRRRKKEDTNSVTLSESESVAKITEVNVSQDTSYNPDLTQLFTDDWDGENTSSYIYTSWIYRSVLLHMIFLS